MLDSRSLFASVIILVGAVSAASAQEMEIFVANNTDMDIVEAGVSVAGANYWLDLDQGTVLGPKHMFTFTVTPEEGCRFDFRATFADGSEQTIRDVEVCQASAAGTEVWAQFD